MYMHCSVSQTNSLPPDAGRHDLGRSHLTASALAVPLALNALFSPDFCIAGFLHSTCFHLEWPSPATLSNLPTSPPPLSNALSLFPSLQGATFPRYPVWFLVCCLSPQREYNLGAGRTLSVSFISLSPVLRKSLAHNKCSVNTTECIE